MKLDRFFKNLVKIKGEYNWYIAHGGLIRANRKTNKSITYCPVTAMYRSLKNKTLNTYSIEKAGTKLGLSIRDLAKIQNASDSECPISETRKKILEILKPEKRKDTPSLL